MLQRAETVLAGLWAGLLLGIAAIAAPSVFAGLEGSREQAGVVARLIFASEARASLVFAIVLFVIERRLAERRAQAGEGSRISAELLLPLGALFCVVLGYFALQPLMEAARAGTGKYSFAALHATSTVFYGIKTLLVLVLAWRASGKR